MLIHPFLCSNSNSDERGACLLNKPQKNLLKSHTIHIPNPNTQCKMAYGKSARVEMGPGNTVSKRFLGPIHAFSFHANFAAEPKYCR